MPFTLKELKERLARLDEVTLLEVLDISSEDLVERFEDFIEEHAEYLTDDLEEEQDEIFDGRE
jgi:TusA-related sulfurtransferase